MGKCMKCGKDSFLFKNFKLKDGEICKKCFRSLGFDKSYDLITNAYSFDEIKDGIDEMQRRWEEERKKKIQEAVRSSIKVTTRGLHPEKLNCEPEEWQIYDEVYIIFKEHGGNIEDLKFERWSDNYMTAKHKGEVDLARFHWGPRSKWIVFPCLEKMEERHEIESVKDVRKYEDLIVNSMESLKEWD